MQISARFDGMTQLFDSLSQHARQIPYATMLAINWTATTAQRAGYAAIRAQLDNPTPIVKRGLFIDYAKKERLWAEVRVKDRDGESFGSRSMAEQIGQQFAGGTRQAKTMERVFQRAGLIGSGEYLVPGQFAKLDRYGNLSRAQLNQIYKAINRLGGQAPDPTARRRRPTGASAARYFWADGTGKLRRGLWSADATGALRLVLVAVPSVTYRGRVDLQGITTATVARDFRKNFDRGMRQAIRTAR